MDQQIEQRIELIDNYGSYINWKEKTLEQKLKMLRWMAPFNFWMSIVVLLLLFFVSFLSSFHLLFFNWQNAGVFAVMPLGLGWDGGMTMAELKLLRHQAKLERASGSFLPILNEELGSLIVHPVKSLGISSVVYISTFLLFIAALVQFFVPYLWWNYAGYPSMVISLAMIILMIRKVQKIQDNLKKVENQLTFSQ